MSWGPGDASGWPWKQNAGLSVRARPCRVPSNRLTCVGPQVGGQRLFVHREAVVLARDAHAAVVQVLDRVVRAVVAELHLEGFRARSQRHDLVAQADPEGGVAGLDQVARRLDRVVAGLGVAGAVGEEHAVGLELLHLLRRGLRRNDRDLAAAFGQHAQDVLLHAVVERDDVVLRLALLAVAGAQAPFALRPVVGLVHGDDLGQVQAAHRWRGLGRGNRLLDQGGRDLLALGQADDAAVLRAVGAQQAREPARIDVGDGDGVLAAQVLRQRLRGAEVGREQRQVADDQSGGVDLAGFDVFFVDAVVADVRIRERHDLLAVARVGEDFLVAGDGRVEHDFAGAGAGGSDRIANKDRAVCKRQDGGREGSLSRQKHWVLRMCRVRPGVKSRIYPRQPPRIVRLLSSGMWLECARRTGFAGKPLIIAEGVHFHATLRALKALSRPGRPRSRAGRWPPPMRR